MMREFWDKFEFKQKASSIGTAMIVTAETEAIAGRLESSLDSHRTRPMGMVNAIYGPSFVGKTTACEEWMLTKAEQLGGTFETYTPKLTTGDEQDHLASLSYVEIPGPGVPRRPIVMINVGAGPTFKGLLRDTVHALTRRVPTERATNNALTITLGKQLRRRGTELLIFDSAQYLTNKMNVRDQNHASEMLLAVCKKVKTETVIVGDKTMISLFDDYPELKELDEQQYEVSPFPRPIFRERYGKGAEPAFYKFVADMVQRPGFSGKTDLLGKWELEVLYDYTQGLPGRISKLLQLGTKYAVAHKVQALDSNVLFLTLRDMRNTPDTVNPFRRGDNEPAYQPHVGVFTL